MADPLMDAARAAQARAWCPYSRFPVGAALEAEDGRVFTGCNVENVSFGLSVCAERVAVGAAVSAGARRFRRLAVVSGAEPPAPPCGACRQVLAEFGSGVEIVCVGRETERRYSLAELLPAAFEARHLPGIGGAGT
jgi:cytidine deaminase